MNALAGWIPLFPLDLALLPGALLPLHVFEPRYRALATRSLEGDRRFAVARMHDGQLARVGCVARIVQVLNRYPDGRSDILIRGEERFALLDLREHADGYLEARSETVRDEPGPAPDPEDRLLLERLFRDYARLADDDALLGGAPEESGRDAQIGPGEDADDPITADADDPTAADADDSTMADADIPTASDADDPTTADAGALSFTLAVRIPLGADERQTLLECLSERERTLALLGHLVRLVPRLRAHEKDRRKVRGNGKLVPAEE